jgi:uncharacterized protein with PQ loop repeat
VTLAAYPALGSHAGANDQKFQVQKFQVQKFQNSKIQEGNKMETNIAVIAGTVSTIIFVLSTLPMLLKAFHTKDMHSYSLGNILLSNVGNIVHSVYIFNLPPGPIWLLHSFYLVSTALMLVWYLRYERWTPMQ